MYKKQVKNLLLRIRLAEILANLFRALKSRAESLDEFSSRLAYLGEDEVLDSFLSLLLVVDFKELVDQSHDYLLGVFFSLERLQEVAEDQGREV